MKWWSTMLRVFRWGFFFVFFLISHSVSCSEGKLSSIRKQESSVKMQQLLVRACWNHHETWTVLEARLWNKIACNEQLCLTSSASVFLNCQLLAESFFQAQEQILLIQGSEKFLKPSGSHSSFISWFLANLPSTDNIPLTEKELKQPIQ